MKTNELKPRKKVVAMAPHDRGWSNVEYLKDCGLIPYLLYKNHNCDVTFVGAQNEEWPYLDTYLKGVKAEILSPGTVPAKIAYIRQFAKDIDCLILRGPYSDNIPVATLYKELNPNGKIYDGLDANSWWMDQIPHQSPHFTAFMDACDVIATSCTAMQKHLNEKWSWKIEHIPNGSYNFEVPDIVPSFSQKENRILTVSRLGTTQKANPIMLEAFALIADKIPSWNFYLVGCIEVEFEPYIDSYFKRFPRLKNRVFFTGPIPNKTELTDMYLKSKIFALSSVLEGGTPNVIGEALSRGCVIATTKIDAWEEAINYGKCGLACDINDIVGFAKILLTLCQDKDLATKSKEAYLHSQHTLNMEKAVARLYLMLFGEN